MHIGDRSRALINFKNVSGKSRFAGISSKYIRLLGGGNTAETRTPEQFALDIIKESAANTQIPEKNNSEAETIKNDPVNGETVSAAGSTDTGKAPDTEASAAAVAESPVSQEPPPGEETAVPEDGETGILKKPRGGNNCRTHA